MNTNNHQHLQIKPNETPGYIPEARIHKKEDKVIGNKTKQSLNQIYLIKVSDPFGKIGNYKYKVMKVRENGRKSQKLK